MRRNDVRVTFDHERALFIVDYGLPERKLTPEERPGAAKASVSKLLAQAFGQPTGEARPGFTVPAHLKKYVKR